MSLENEAPQEYPEAAAIRQRFPEGSRVRLTADVERYPHFIARQGMTGVVSESDGPWHGYGYAVIAVELDEPLPGAEEWDNQVIWMGEDLIDPDTDEMSREVALAHLTARDALGDEACPADPAEFQQQRAPRGTDRRSHTFAVKFEESMPDGEPVAFVSGLIAQGAYVVEPVSYDEGGPVETAWVLSGHGEHDDRERAEPWLEAALNALSAEWWMRGERARRAERAAGWDPTP